MANKYFAKKTTVDGITFHSKKEAKRYSDLRLLEKAGKIIFLMTQPSFPLNIGDTTLGKYILDFQYRDGSGDWVYEDVKGWDKKKNKWLVTPLSAWKKKHVEAEYGITVNYV